MLICSQINFSRCLLVLAVVVMLPASTALAQEADYTTAQLKRALRETNQEYKEFKSLKSKLESAARQSSNTARGTTINKFQNFMGECIKRRQESLGEVMTIKQHGELVTSGTTSVSEVGSPVPTGNNSVEQGIYQAPYGNRVRQLSNMKALYTSAKLNSQLATERQGNSLERYNETIDEFGQQLDGAINWLEGELAKREAEAEAKEAQEEALYKGEDK